MLLVPDREDSFQSIPVMGGVPQESVLRSTLQNVFYDDLLRMTVPEGGTPGVVEDDLAVVAVVHTGGEHLDQAVNPVLTAVDEWMTRNRLLLSHHKFEIVVFTRKWAQKCRCSTRGFGSALRWANVFPINLLTVFYRFHRYNVRRFFFLLFVNSNYLIYQSVSNFVIG